MECCRLTWLKSKAAATQQLQRRQSGANEGQNRWGGLGEQLDPSRPLPCSPRASRCPPVAEMTRKVVKLHYCIVYTIYSLVDIEGFIKGQMACKQRNSRP